MILFTADDLKRLEALRDEVEKIEITEDDKRRFADLERELASMDLDFLLQ